MSEHRYTYYVIAGFDQFQSGTIPVAAISEEQAKEMVLKLLADKKNVEIFDIYRDTDVVESTTNKSSKIPTFGFKDND